MNRNPIGNQSSNFENPNGGPVQFLEARYTGVGPQEWIYAPDSGEWAVTMFFLEVGGGSAFLEGTDEPPCDVGGTCPASPRPDVLNEQHFYPITETVTDTTRVIVKCCTAVRVNVLGGTVDVTARC